MALTALLVPAAQWGVRLPEGEGRLIKGDDQGEKVLRLPLGGSCMLQHLR
ncbi:hypothetical protein N9H39_07295 [Gammaproteobacteria bacterium]|nr:hypothetical protein [Gammaproteobacteria bacterium]